LRLTAVPETRFGAAAFVLGLGAWEARVLAAGDLDTLRFSWMQVCDRRG
jgi:hypothetical protein